jgi:hypothetical protein
MVSSSRDQRRKLGLSLPHFPHIFRDFAIAMVLFIFINNKVVIGYLAIFGQRFISRRSVRRGQSLGHSY